MSRYRRAKIEGALLFFTLALADRSSDLLVREIDSLRRAYKAMQERHPLETIAICILPDHLHALGNTQALLDLPLSPVPGGYFALIVLRHVVKFQRPRVVGVVTLPGPQRFAASTQRANDC